ncbi:DNA repair protein SMC6 [Sugiyamaella lignohabitans]|uniref:DNA repair protein SMC6 n=1 Tax=Sugiyamaella lignohabitans TaxID=796027 RepID=A0A161HIM4_9ASCO|nr:DNA repair protein SMC6 [Sugiyamaella lignohabitans]ANB11038.1 DNA repair protein SMC6 [Sugiyamaella lignohabitans]
MEKDMTIENLAQKILELRATMETLEKENGCDMVELVKQYTEANTALLNAKKEYDNLNRVYSVLIGSSKNRESKYEAIVTATLDSIKKGFKVNLGMRGFNGKLIIDRTEENLIMDIDPVKSAVTRKVETLSGGEKSFAQIALLISIWRAMPSKLLALDEFDVFMDNANRKQSLDMVIKSLGNRYNAQSIVITPQDMEIDDVQLKNNDITIQRMPDPVRSAPH